MADEPGPTAPQETPPAAAPGIDLRRLVLVIAVCVGGLIYFFWDDVRDILKPPEIAAPAIPADALLPENQVDVKAGPLAITFTTVGAAVVNMTWTNPADGHVETLISQDEPNRAFVVELPGRADFADLPFTLVKQDEKDGVTSLQFASCDLGDGFRLVKTFDIESNAPVIRLEVQFKKRSTLLENGFVLKVCDAVGVPSELDKDDGLISVRSDTITDHHKVRRVSGVQDWPTKEERLRAGHAGIEAPATLEWVAAADKYFGIIVRPEQELAGAEMTFTRTAKSAAAVRIHVPLTVQLAPARFQIYAGPKNYDALAELPGRVQESINYWYFGRATTLLLKWIHRNTVQNYGVAIVIVTIIFRLLMWPVTRYNLRSLVDIKVANARLAEIDAREPPRSEVQARAAWLKEARVWEDVQRKATVGVFLPMLILLPVLLILYYTLNAGYEFYRQPLGLWIHDISRRDPFFVLPVLMGLAMMGQLRTMSENSAKERSWIFMPLAFTLLFAFFSAGLVLFWLVDTLAGWGQLITIKRGKRRAVPPEHPPAGGA